MLFRILAAALLLSALGSTLVQASGGEKCETRECRFDAFNPPVLCVSECIDVSCLVKKIRVETNAHTIVCIKCSDFVRYERDCDGNVLQTFDTIEAQCVAKFIEDPHCQNGAPLKVKPLGNDCFCVESHRGGWFLELACVPCKTDLCDDCGCYQSTCRIEICVIPCEKECDGHTPPPTIQLKGNNGVGNGLDPQPPGNPPINDGPGTSPGNPGNQGGAH